MSRNRATGSYSYNVICDICGFKKKASEVRKRWDGYIVCDKDYEMRHPLDFYTTRNDVHPLPYIRSDSSRVAVPKLGTITSTASNGTTAISTLHTITGSPSSYLQTLSTSLTIMAWIRPDALDGKRFGIFSNNSSGDTGAWSFEAGGTSGQGWQNALYFKAGATVQARSHNNMITSGAWQHVCYTRDGTTQVQALYINQRSSFVDTGTWVAIASNANPIFIGRTSSTVAPAVGAIRDIRIYNYAMTADQVLDSLSINNTSLYGSTATGLMAWYKCDDNSTTFTDSQTNGGTSNLTATVTTDIAWETGTVPL